MSLNEAEVWCSDKGIVFSPDVAGLPRVVRYPEPWVDPLAIQCPTDVCEMTSLVCAMTQADGFASIAEFTILLTDWDIWSAEGEAIAQCMINSIRLNARDPRGLMEAPAHTCGIAELAAVQALLFTVLSFRWDAYLIPSNGVFLMHLNHDGYVQAWARSASEQESLKRLFDPWPDTPVAW